ncbi:flagellar basal-body rod protein FlgF [Wansuia hejianensis]|uniref:Flagellar basal-body rod protein FlgF n=1 Tax=Wansuia hejianensis TaxID=2763667 RepID=A0A926IM66_9FIRM|nr:flagellar basal-body rod protein FlgF [Wansuia hejianensis]MBC8590296.1 flagellar basal-body rod protein FlgF [Wansuia hejianensis]
MLRSLYAGVSGMRSFQTKMDVISNNIANVNTTGFKSGRVKFQDMLSQTVANAQGPTANGLGGVNPQQVGLGVKVGSIDTIMTGGPLQPTNRDLDFAMEGEGFFILRDAGGTNFYTRDGAFFTDHEGNLVNASGLLVMGYLPDGGIGTGDKNPPTDPQNATLQKLTIPYNGDQVGLDADYELQDFTIDATGKIIGVYSNGDMAETATLGYLAVSKFNNPEGLEKAGNNNYIRSNNSGEPENGLAGEAGFGYIRQGFLEMSNVDLANEFTEMIVTSRAYQANSRSITTSDEMLMELINLKR